MAFAEAFWVGRDFAPATPSKVTFAARKKGERYFALLKVNTLNFEDPEKSKHKVNFVGAAQTLNEMPYREFESLSLRH